MIWTVYQSFKYSWEWWVTFAMPTLEMEGGPVDTACSMYVLQGHFLLPKTALEKKGKGRQGKGRRLQKPMKESWIPTVTFFLRRVTKFTFLLPEKDLSDTMKPLMSNCVGGMEVDVLTDSIGRTRNVKHPVSSKKGMHNLSAQKAGIRHGNSLEFCTLFDLRPHWILPQTLSMTLSIYRIYLYGKCRM